MFLSVAWAQAAATPGAEQPGAFMTMVVPAIMMFGIMYFMLIRPQSKRQKEHLKFLSEIKRGDEIVTTSGILGRVEGLTDMFVTLEISDGVRVKMLRSQIATSSKAAIASNTTEKKA